MPEVECLGPVSPTEIPDVIKEIEDEGNHFLHVPKLPGSWPKNTSGVVIESQEEPEEDGCGEGG